jgi:hypothetical protein
MPQNMKSIAARIGGVGPGAAAVRYGARGAVTVFVLITSVGGCGVVRNDLPAATHQSSAFAVLNTARTGSDAIPRKFAHDMLKNGGTSLFSANIQDPRRIRPNRQAWLVPAPGDVFCLVRVVYPLIALGVHGERLAPIMAGTCSSEAAAKAGRLMATQSLIATFAKLVPTRVCGIVPNGVRHVVAHSSGKAVRTVTVQRNAYEFTMINPRSVSFVTNSGGHQRRYVIPTPTVAGAKPYPGSRPG